MQKLQLSIPEPCHENWHNMTPTEQGRFCNACAKEVIDFSMMTDTEVLNYFTSITHEKVCGRTLPSQLDRTITRPKEPKKRLFWYWNYIVMFFMFFSKANTVKAQGGIKRVTEISNAPACKVGETVKSSSRVISGRVTDINGNPVSFATIKVKGTPTALSANASGVYSIKASPNDVIAISATSFKFAEVHVGSQSVLNTVLESDATSGEVVVVVGGCFTNRNLNEEIVGIDNPKYYALLEVKDDASASKINKARIIISKKYDTGQDTAFTNKKGIYKLKGINDYDEYYIKVEAEGYQPNEFTISGRDFKDKKKIWEVSLKKIKVVKSNEQLIILGGVSAVSSAKGPIYVVDGTIIPDENKVDKTAIEDITVLQAPEAMAIFGPVGSNGAIVITTIKPKVKNLDTVVVSSGYLNKKLVCRTGGVNVQTKVMKYADMKARIVTKLTDSLKVYPNPVQKGTALSVSLKLKQPGAYSIQVTDATGRIVLQKQINIPAKEYIEQVQSGSRWGSGIYYIRVFDNNNKPISKASFIVQ